MKKLIYIIFLLLIVFTTKVSAQSQTIVTKKWASCIGRPDTVNWAASTFDSYGCLTVTGSKYIGSNNTDVFVVKYDINGNIMWQTTYNGTSSGLDYGVAIVASSNGDVYVAAATTTVGSGLDMAILKYSNTGTLTWTAKWSGTASFNDVPSCIALNSVGDIFIAGSTYAAATLYNYALIKYNSSGTKLWQSTYDYTAKTDFATAMVVNSANDVIITGSSAVTSTNSDFTTLKYAGSNGALLNTKRINVSGHGQDIAAAIAKDDSDNIIITGYTYANSNYDIQTAKLSSTLVLKWTKTFDGEGLDDATYDIGVDIYGNIFITGQTRKLNNGIDFITKKYNRAGTELWSNRYPADDETKYAKASKLFVKSNGNVIVAGTADRSNNSDIVAIEYDSAGSIKWEKYYNGSGDTNDMALSVKCNNNGSVYITGMSRDLYDTMRYATIRYDYDLLDNEVIRDTTSDTSTCIDYIKNQLIVKFKPNIVNTAIVDNKEWLWGSLEEIISDSNYTNTIYTKLGLGSNHEDELKIYKIFTGLTTADSISISRLGDSVKMQPLWSAFMIAIPDNLGTFASIDSLNFLDTIIEYAEPNYVYTTFSDEYTNKQASLIANTDYPNANINLNDAWNSEVGQSYIKVGVVDWPIYWKHEEFGDGSFYGSKIRGGYDYYNKVGIDKITNFEDPHGTEVGGIIGAWRNNTISGNTKGIAGIAGGDADNGNSGVSLYSLGIFGIKKKIFVDDKPKIASAKEVANAITHGAYNTTNGYGFGLHIENSSWGGGKGGDLLQNAINTCYLNGCAFFAARGNYYGADWILDNPEFKKRTDQPKSVTSKVYPACYGDRTVFNIGASGNEGTHKLVNDNGDYIYESMYDNGVDVIAPGSSDIVLTTTIPGAGQLAYFADNKYSWFSGTSAACPHAAGVAALMMSRHHPDNPNNAYGNVLHPDDVKALFKKYSDDITGHSPDQYQTYTYASGYDIYNGYGRLNAGNLLLHIDIKNGFYIHHLRNPSRTISTSTNVDNSIVLPIEINNAGVGHYDGYLCTVTDQYTYTLPYSTCQIIDNWPINCLDNLGIDNNSSVTNTPYRTCTISVSGTTATITTVTYCWHLTYDHTYGNVDYWIPKNPNYISSDWSLQIHDPTITSVAAKTLKSTVTVYPNPAYNCATISYVLDYLPKTLVVDVYDLTGKFVTHLNNVKQNFENISFDVTDWSAGLYFINIKTDKETIIRKFVKN